MYEHDAPAEIQTDMVRNLVQTFGTGGILEQDDTEAWVAIQRSLRGPRGRSQWFTYQAKSPGYTTELPGFNFRGVARDDCQWLGWQRYFDLLQQPDGEGARS